MSSLYRDKNNFAKPTTAHDFSPELGIGSPASGRWVILKLFPRKSASGKLEIVLALDADCGRVAVDS
jgi:hypothetical protein